MTFTSISSNKMAALNVLMKAHKFCVRSCLTGVILTFVVTHDTEAEIYRPRYISRNSYV